jgi:PIN domain nuclease of toxin-antitoxin system
LTRWVLDASAVLAVIQAERGAEVVAPRLPSSMISAANAAEVVARLIDIGKSPDLASRAVADLTCEIVPVDATIGLRAGELRALTRGKGLSLGDRICLALAEREGVPALTADRAWAELQIGVEVSLIR